MLLWLGFALLTAVVVAVLLRPLVAGLAPDRRVPEAALSGAGGAVYRDQLAEIEAERARGLIGDTEAEAARVEIARRLLAAADASTRAAPAQPLKELGAVATVLAAGLPVLSVVVYLALGAPSQPGQPFASRGADPTTSAGVAKLVERVEERLRANPEDGRGWDVVAPVYLRMGRHHEAANAFDRAIRLNGESTERLAGLAEAHILANDGMVSEIARKSYERLRVLAPDRVEPRFWLAVAAEQEGRTEEAMKAYTQILTEGSAAAPWRASVSERWRAVRRKLNLPTEPLPDGVAEARPTNIGPKLSREDVRAIQQLPEAERKRMIEDMVAGLDRQLSEDGQDLEGWQRLIRAYTVLGRREDALSALQRARTALAKEATALEALGELAKSLGLAS